MSTGATRGVQLRAAVLVLLLAAGVAVALVAELPDQEATRAAVTRAGVAGWAAMAGVVSLLLMAPVPRSAVTVLVGVVAGFWVGLAIAYTGGLLAALGAFALSRGLGRAAVQRLAGPRLSRFDGAVTDRAFPAVLTARLLPVLPFPAVNYGFGLSGVPARTFLAASALGLVPSSLVQIGVGASAGSLVSGGTPGPAVVGTVVGAVVVLSLAWGAALWRRRRAAAAA